MCLETYWSDRHVQAFRERSVRPFFEGWGKGYDNLVYFGACSVFRGKRGEDFARKFLRALGYVLHVRGG